jgi:hypothetical protein
MRLGYRQTRNDIDRQKARRYGLLFHFADWEEVWRTRHVKRERAEIGRAAQIANGHGIGTGKVQFTRPGLYGVEQDLFRQKARPQGAVRNVDVRGFQCHAVADAFYHVAVNEADTVQAGQHRVMAKVALLAVGRAADDGKVHQGDNALACLQACQCGGIGRIGILNGRDQRIPVLIRSELLFEIDKARALRKLNAAQHTHFGRQPGQPFACGLSGNSRLLQAGGEVRRQAGPCRPKRSTISFMANSEMSHCAIYKTYYTWRSSR